MKTLLFIAGIAITSMVGAAPFGDGFPTGKPGDYLEGNVEKTRIDAGALVINNTQVNFKTVAVDAGKAYRLSFDASFSGDVESIEDNPRFDLFTLPGERSAILPTREILFLDGEGKAIGGSSLCGMPFREKREYLDFFHVPTGAEAFRLKVASGVGLALSLRNLKFELLADSTTLNLNPSFALGQFNYSGWHRISQGGKLIEREGKTVLDTKYGSRGTEFPLAGPGTYALSAKATGNGYNSTVHLDVFDADGKKMMRASLRRFDTTNHFVLPAGATSASLLVYSCLLEEVRVRRIGDEQAIER